MFLSVETNCFDERNGFQQFSESLEWFGAVFELKKIPVVTVLMREMVQLSESMEWFGVHYEFSRNFVWYLLWSP